MRQGVLPWRGGKEREKVTETHPPLVHLQVENSLEGAMQRSRKHQRKESLQWIVLTVHGEQTLGRQRFPIPSEMPLHAHGGHQIMGGGHMETHCRGHEVPHHTRRGGGDSSPPQES